MSARSEPHISSPIADGAGRLLALTGATGFLGGRIAALAGGAGWRVRTLQRRPDVALDGVWEVVPGDLADGRALARLVDGADAVVHNAGLVRAPSPGAFMAANALGANAVARAVLAVGGPPFVLVSSLAASRPSVSPYAASKAVAEAGLRRILANHPFAILRPPAIYGPADAATKPMFQAMAKGFAPMPGPVDVRLAMIYVDDAAAAVLAALGTASPFHPVYEVDDGACGYTWREIRSAGEAAAGRRLRPIRLPMPLIRTIGELGGIGAWMSDTLGFQPPFLTPGKVAEMRAGDWIADPARSLPQWQAEVSLEAGFRRTLAWYREAG
ncbi:MAG: NAD-dependent epimerase/dehydratase family protein [Alphaproteobacteria bacterium]|jgi:2-alkyl-3-oxoalkanoate reductase|nr:NAD-dependent epimerase/dehydratase family protein [Alphaproteobacteria bacterium]